MRSKIVILTSRMERLKKLKDSYLYGYLMW
jgi:hypothetical protein